MIPDTIENSIFIIEMVRKVKSQMRELFDEYSTYGVGMIEKIMFGNAYHGIKSIIAEQEVDMVVMGTSGSSGLKEILIGSTTEKVVRHAKCPVLSIHKKHTDFEYKDIVLATSMGDDEMKIIDTVKMIQQWYGAKIHLLRVNTPNNFERDIKAIGNMEAFAQKNGLSDYTINVFNDVSDEEGIVYFSESIKADMIMLATHGRTGFAHLLTGSIAEDVVNHASRPVLTLVTKNH